MDVHEDAIGVWPNVALVPGTHTHAATGEEVAQPGWSRIGPARTCSGCLFSGTFDGERFPGPAYAGRMYCIAIGDGCQGEWTEPDGGCDKWKPKR